MFGRPSEALLRILRSVQIISSVRSLSSVNSRFASALFFVLVANALLSVSSPGLSVAAIDLPSSHTWEWWRSCSFLKRKSAPDVVLMGSSLMMIPVSVLDADYLGANLDAVFHDHSVYMEGLLSKRLISRNLISKSLRPGVAVDQSVSCFNFAVPGGMVSDDYMIQRALFKKTNAPKLIVLGLTLRDFIESHVPCAGATSTFKYFKRFFDIDDIVDIAMPQFWQRFDYWQSKLVYMVGERLNLQAEFSQLVRNNIQSVAQIFGSEKFGFKFRASEGVFSASDSTGNVARNLKSEAEPGDFVLKAGQIYPYEDNSSEYRKRFASPSEKLFGAEKSFLAKLLSEANQKGIKVILVNMPLTACNMALMPQGYYQRYLDTLRSEAGAAHDQVLDLNTGTKFGISDFRDTAHMNAKGGKKLIDSIVECMMQNESLVSDLSNRQSQNSGFVKGIATRAADVGSL